MQEWLSTQSHHPTDLFFSVPDLSHSDLVEIQNEIGGFSIDTLMRYILEEGYQMDELEFATGVVDEMLSTALESYCMSFGLSYNAINGHALGKTVTDIATASVSALAEIALDIRDTLLANKVPVITDMNICGYRYVESLGNVVHLQQLPNHELHAVAKFRENQTACQTLSTLMTSLKSPTLY